MQRIRFQQDLDGLRGRLLTMGGLAEQAIERSVKGYATVDAELCRAVLEAAPAIDRLEREIDRKATDMLAMQQPMATDLRLILAVLRINADLERVGDQAANIARLGRDLLGMPAVELPIDVARMASLTSLMVRRALAAFVAGDAEMADSVMALDGDVDELNQEAFHGLSQLIERRPELAPQALNAILVARNLERIGDHATNIAEDVIFWVSGADVRHVSDLRVA